MPDDDKAVAGARAASAAGTTRRHALGVMGATVSVGAVGAALSTTAAQAQQAPAPLRIPAPPPALAPRAELVNVLEYETQARLMLGAQRVAPIMGSDRTVTDRITLHPRWNIPTRDLDLTATLFGDQHFTPIIVGPIANQRRFHADGEVAMARGASAAKAAMVISSESSVPLAAIAQAATTPLYVQVYAGSPRVQDVLVQANAARARAIFVTVGAGTSATAVATPTGAAIDWAGVDAVIKGTALPVVVKGITRPQDAREAVKRGAKGIVVSNYRGGSAASLAGTLLLVAPVVQAVGSQVPVLVDGSFRRGTDIVKAFGFGAKGVLVGRPVMWGLAAYGADGVQGVVEMLQTETARYMCMCGRPSLASVDSSMVRVHAPRPTVR